MQARNETNHCRTVIVRALGIGMLFFLTPSLFADGLEEFKASLRRHAAETKTIHYEIIGEELIPKGGMIGKLPLADRTYPISASFKIDFANSLVLRRSASEYYFAPAKDFKPYITSVFFNGKTARNYGPISTKDRIDGGLSKANPYVVFRDPSPKAGIEWYRIKDLPIFLAHGYFLDAVYPVSLCKLSDGAGAPASLTADGEATIAGARHLVFKTAGPAGIARFWVDPKRDYTVVQAELQEGRGATRHLLEIIPKLTEWGWTPDTWQYTLLQKGDVATLTNCTAKLTKVNCTLDKTEFEGDALSPGDIVHKGGTKQFFFVNDSGSLTAFDLNGPPTSPMWRYALVSAGVVGVSLLGIGIYRLWQRRQRTRCPA